MADVESGSHTDEAQNRTEEKRHAGTIDEQAESDSEQNEEQGGCAGAGVGYESSSNDVGEGGNHNQQGNPSKDGEENLGFFSDVGFDNLADTLAFIAQRSHQRTVVMYAAEEDAADNNPQCDGNLTEDSSRNRTDNRAGACN